MAITHDAATAGGTVVTGSTLTFSYTIKGEPNRLLVVSAATKNPVSALTVSGVTYNAVALTKAIAIPTVEASGNEAGSFPGVINTEMWYLLEATMPAAGAYNIIVTLSSALPGASAGALIGAAQSASWVRQEAPEATASMQTGTNGTAYSSSIATVTPSAWVFDALAASIDAHWAADAGQTERTDGFAGVNPQITLATSTKVVASPGSTTLGWTADIAQTRVAHVLAAWRPYSLPLPNNYQSVKAGTGMSTGERVR